LDAFQRDVDTVQDLAFTKKPVGTEGHAGSSLVKKTLARPKKFS
jgi:hypothetical protein